MPTGVQPMTLSLWHRRALLVLLSVCTYTPQLVYGCGPGPGIGTRHRPRKLVPLRYKQYVPQISENNLGASGRPEGKITRDSERFNELVCNYNIHIVFKDEEHTQADRFMTKRLKDCLDRLAIAVMLQWPKTLLRVTEAWDEDGNHPPDSLHYEGRAVDITTSDRNNSKYGLLAQLAVEAGFDWVHYESKHHVHCSVKADHSLALERGGCFPGSGQVTVEGRGQIPMSSLKPGNKVLARTKSGKVVFSEVLLFLHKDIGRRSVFLVIQTEDGQTLALTPNHLIFHSPLLQHERDPSNYQAHFASRLERGDYILVHSTGDTVRPCKVISVTQEERSGMYAPLTAEGTLFVDGMLVSSYASVENHELAHWAFAPLRFLLSFPLWTQEARHEAGQASVAADPPYRLNIDHSRHHMYQKGQNCTLELKCQGWNQNLPQTPLVKKYFGQTTEEDLNQGHIHWYAKILQLLGQILLDPLMFY